MPSYKSNEPHSVRYIYAITLLLPSALLFFVCVKNVVQGLEKFGIGLALNFSFLPESKTFLGEGEVRWNSCGTVTCLSLGFWTKKGW